MMTAKRRIAAALFLAGAVAGCSGTRPYVASTDDNVRIRTETKSGSVLSSVRASVHVHSVDRNCRTSYLGTIPLDSKAVTTGIPAGRRTYLVFAFNSASFLGSRRSSISYRTLLTPRRGYDYEVAVRYVDDMYNAEIREVSRRGKRRRTVRYRPLSTCRAGIRNANSRGR